MAAMEQGYDHDTFLTALRAEGSTSPGTSPTAAGGANGSLVQEPESMDRVRGLKSKLGTVVETLNDKVGAVLQKQRKEFLTAYRAHMYNVHKELEELRAKVDEAELAMQKNEKIHKLELERNWYRGEALRLDTFCSSMKKEMNYMKDRLCALEDDRNWLERQLKDAKKRNKLLCAELNLRLSDGADDATAYEAHTREKGTRPAPPLPQEVRNAMDISNHALRDEAARQDGTGSATASMAQSNVS